MRRLVTDRRVLAAALVAVLTGTGCAGDNLFSGDSESYQPVTTAVTAPQQVSSGQAIDVRVAGVAVRGIARIDISLSGAFHRDTSVVITGSPRQTSQVVRFIAPTAVQDTVLLVTAAIVDEAGAMSSPVRIASIVSGPPAVIAVSGPASTSLGSTALIQVQASGSHPITELIFQLRGAVVRDTVISVPGARNVFFSLPVVLPPSAADTVLHISVSARDNQGRTGPAQATLVPLSVPPPTIALIGRPDVVSALSTMQLRFRATSGRPLSKLHLFLRGATTRDTVINIPSGHFDFIEDVNVRLLAGEPLFPHLIIRAQAEDISGARSTMIVDSITVLTNEPVIRPEILSVGHPISIGSGQVLDVRVHARGQERPISRIEVRLRGAVETAADVVAVINPARHELIRDFKITIPCQRGVDEDDNPIYYSGQAFVHAVAYDEATVPSTIYVSSFDVFAAECPGGATGGGSSSVGGIAAAPDSGAQLAPASPFNLSATGQRRGGL